MEYVIKQFPDKKFASKMDQTRFIKEKYSEMKKLKLAEYKTNAQAMIDSFTTKEFIPEIEDVSSDVIIVKSVINTTNIIDNHLDLHMSEVWNKTVSDNPYSYHLKQHEQKFESVLSSKAKSYNEPFNFNQLGLNIDFNTIANINEFLLKKSDNPFMFDKYVSGEVKQHSVGMLYVNIDFAFYDEDSQKNMDFFNEMKAKAVNPEIADEYGYFCVVYEAKKREGSAVVFGSNSVTPTLSVKNYEPSLSDTRKSINEPSVTDTQEIYKYLINNLKNS